MKIFIPLQLASTRVKRKNIREFYNGESLFDIKIKQLLKNFRPEDIYVSSEDEIVSDLCRKYDINFLKRDISLTGNNIFQADLINHFLLNVKSDDDVMWVQVTQPLFDKFDEMLIEWNNLDKNKYNSLVAVKTFKNHLISEAGLPINFNFGYWHVVTQNLPKLYELLWACFIQTRESIERVKYQIGSKPKYKCFDDITLVDIDTENDFRLAAIIYKTIISNNTNQ